MATLLLKPDVVTKPAAEYIGPPSGAEDHFALERGLALVLLAVAALYLRARDPLYNTAYMDESIYVVYGRMFLSHHFQAPLNTPLQWSFGWYLWPAMAALADRVGGLFAVRELAALLGTVTVAATYGFAGRVFSKTVGLGAAAVMAVVAPAVLVSRIATRDSGSVCFFAVALWAFAAAWQENKKRSWILAALFSFAAFLCKYLVAIYFPLLVVLALWKGKKAFLLFSMPLSAMCVAYAGLHWADLLHLLRYGSSYGSLRADPFTIYVASRKDMVLIAWLAVVAFAAREWRIRAAWMWVGALVVLVFQWQTRADYDFWKHVNYALIFLVPAAIAGVLFLVQRLFRTDYIKQMQWGTVAVLGVVFGTAWLGNLQNFRQFVFWPNVSPVLAFFEDRITPQDTILVDDTVFRYYFSPPLDQAQIIDPMYFHYRDSTGNDLFGEKAYKAAVGDRVFSHIIFDGGMGEEARKLDAAIRRTPAAYRLQMRAIDPVLGHDIEVYSREPVAAAVPMPGPAAPSIQILSPKTGAAVNGPTILAQGIATGAQQGWYVRIEIFTDRWYPQGESVPVASDGSFRQTIYLGGSGRQRCFHLVRARLMDAAGRSRAVTLNHSIGRDDAKASCSVPTSLNSAQ